MSEMCVSNLYVVLQASFVENIKNLCNERLPPGAFHCINSFFCPLEDKIGDISGLVSSSSSIACHSGKKKQTS